MASQGTRQSLWSKGINPARAEWGGKGEAGPGVGLVVPWVVLRGVCENCCWPCVLFPLPSPLQLLQAPLLGNVLPAPEHPLIITALRVVHGGIPLK